MAGVVASKVRKQRATLQEKEGNKEEQELRQERLRNHLNNKIPVGPGGIRQYPGQKDKRDGGFRPNANGEFEAGGNANVILYVGLGMVAVGLVITFVGLGDKGFQTLELKLIGPTLTGIGLFFALLRVLFCTLPSCLQSCRKCCCCCRNSEEEEKLIKKEQEKLRNEVLAREQLAQQQQKQLQESKQRRQQEKLQRHQEQRQRMPPPQQQPHHHHTAAEMQQLPPAAARSSNNGTISNNKYNQAVSGPIKSPPPRSSRPKRSRPLHVADSDEEDDIQVRQPSLQAAGHPARGLSRPAEEDSYSTSSSSTFSLNDAETNAPHPLLEGSTKNLRAGEIILNATRLRFEDN